VQFDFQSTYEDQKGVISNGNRKIHDDQNSCGSTRNLEKEKDVTIYSERNR
jgi:hypothetical protein